MTTSNADLSIALVTLLRGPLHAEDAPAVWQAVTTLGPQMRDHLDALGLRLVVDDLERYAYLRTVDELPEGMPRLMRRHSLTYSATVLLILLRQQLTTAEADGETPRLIVTTDEMVEMMRLYHRDGVPDDKIASDIGVLERLGYLRKLRGSTDTFEVRRIIKVIVTADWIAAYGEKLLAAVDAMASDPAPDGVPADDADGRAADVAVAAGAAAVASAEGTKP